MKKTFFLMVLLTLTVGVSTLTFGQQYWNGGQQVSLKIDSLKVCIKFDDSASKANLVNAIDRIVEELSDDNMIHEFFACSFPSTRRC